MIMNTTSHYSRSGMVEALEKFADVTGVKAPKMLVKRAERVGRRDQSLRLCFYSNREGEEQMSKANCGFCGGKGADLQVEIITSPNGSTYRIPLSHTSCKKTVLEGTSLFTLLPEAQGVEHEQPKRSVRKSTRRARSGRAHETSKAVFELLRDNSDGLDRYQLVAKIYGYVPLKINSNTHDRKIRKAIEELRNRNFPILSTSGRSGY